MHKSLTETVEKCAFSFPAVLLTAPPSASRKCRDKHTKFHLYPLRFMLPNTMG